MRMKWKSVFTENLSYKLVSLFIALILWLTILGRRDFSLSRSYELDFLTGPQQTLVYQSANEIKVKMTGPRTALKRLMEQGINPIITIDIGRSGIGEYEVHVPLERIDVPFGVKVVNVRPEKVRVRVSKRD